MTSCPSSGPMMSYGLTAVYSCWIALLASLILAACFYANKIGQKSAASAWLQHFTVKPGSFHHSHAVFIAKWRDLAGIAFGCGRQPGWGEKDGKGGYGIRGFNQLAKLQPEMISIRIIQTSVCVISVYVIIRYNICLSPWCSTAQANMRVDVTQQLLPWHAVTSVATPGHELGAHAESVETVDWTCLLPCFRGSLHPWSLEIVYECEWLDWRPPKATGIELAAAWGVSISMS